jgi:hypothetical protein
VISSSSLRGEPWQKRVGPRPSISTTTPSENSSSASSVENGVLAEQPAFAWTELALSVLAAQLAQHPLGVAPNKQRAAANGLAQSENELPGRLG